MIWLTEISCSLTRSAEFSALLREILGVIVACAEPEPTVSSQHNLYARLRQENMATRLREMIILFMLLRLQLQYCVWFWALWFQKDGKKLSRRGYKDG